FRRSLLDCSGELAAQTLGRQSIVPCHALYWINKSMFGATKCRPVGALRLGWDAVQWLTPLAIDGRRFAASGRLAALEHCHAGPWAWDPAQFSLAYASGWCVRLEAFTTAAVRAGLVGRRAWRRRGSASGRGCR